MSILFKDIIFGPVNSRRMGRSLGINLLPLEFKLCTFNCVYCECGWTEHEQNAGKNLPDRDAVFTALEQRLQQMAKAGDLPDALTFAGNGEPTLHPEFAGIADDTLELRDRLSPDSKVVILSNATTLHRPDVLKALTRFDRNILKLDCGTEETFQLINNPGGSITLEKITRDLINFEGKVILQTLFTRGFKDGKKLDNTSAKEIGAWLERIEKINPDSLMIYSLDRPPPEESLEKVSREELEAIGQKASKLGIRVDIY